MKEKLLKQLATIEKQLVKARAADVRVDGWGTQRYAKKARAWDVLAQEKFEILKKLDEYEN